MRSDKMGLGTKLRHLIAMLDGDVQAVYNARNVAFRPRYYPIVRQLLRSGSASVSAIAQEIGVSQPAATQTLNEMKRLEIIEVFPGADRRERFASLTPRGERLAADLKPLWEAARMAAADLDAELPNKLSETIDSALAALERRSFRMRIEHELARTGEVDE